MRPQVVFLASKRTASSQRLLLWLHSVLVDDLHGEVLARAFVYAFMHHTKAATAQLCGDDIVVSDGHHMRCLLQHGYPLVSVLLTARVQHAGNVGDWTERLGIG